MIGAVLPRRKAASKNFIALPPQSGSKQALLFLLYFEQAVPYAANVLARGAPGGIGQAAGYRLEQAGMMAVDLPLVGRTVIKIAERCKDGTEHQVVERSKRVHQHLVVRSLADGKVKGMIEPGVLGRVYFLVDGGGKLAIAARDQHVVGRGAALGGQAGRLCLEEFPHLEQVVQ